MNDTKRLKVEGIKVRFGGTIALDGVDLSVQSGEILALIGENGAGKSTLMKVLSGAVSPDSGTMFIDGSPYAPNGPRSARDRGVAMIYQELSLAPTLTVEENIVLGAEPRDGLRFNRAAMRSIAAKALEELGHAMPVDDKVNTLSISDQQIVEIARASALGCRILILDEPTSSITRKDVERLFRLMRSLKAKGTSIIYISHFIEEVREIADRFVVLRDGRTVGGGEIANATADEIVTMMVGRKLEELYPRSPHQPGEALLKLDELSTFGKLHSASVQLHRGEVLGIFGLVGSGRTDLVRAVFGLDRVRAGDITVGAYSGWQSPDRRWSAGVGMVSEDRKGEGLALTRSIAENLILSYPQSCESGGILFPARVKMVAQKFIEKLAVRCAGADQKIGNLSGGNQQKIAIARLLHHDVDVLLMDEPTRGIDVGSKRQIYELIDNLACAGKAVLIVSSHLPELLGTCDRIAVMIRGRLTKPTPICQTNEEQIMVQAIASEGEVII